MNIVDRAKKFLTEAKASGEYGYSGPGVDELADALGGEIVEEIQVGKSRWSVIVDYIIKAGDEYMQLTHNEGATEYQDNDMLWDETNSFAVVEPYEVTVTKYRRKV